MRAAGGRFVVRVEDLDFGRVRPGIMEAQLEELRWLGLDWDEGPGVGGPHEPYLQSERQHRYAQALRRLAERGSIFECFCSRREISAAASAPHAGDDEGPVYPGTCLRLDPDALDDRRRTRPAALRFRAPPGPVHFHDLIHGELSFDPSRETGDFVVRRRDGVPAYQLAVVVDDAAMGITHVLRGADLLSSTARQLQLFRALELDPPVWAHVALVLGPDGERLAKRHGEASLRELRERGVPARRVVGRLAASCGLAEPGEEVEPRDLVARFDLAALPRSPAPLPAK